MSFVERVRRGEVPQPTQLKFSLEKWDKAFHSQENISEDDIRLHEIGTWVFERFEEIRQKLKPITFEGLDRPCLLQALVGYANRITFITAHIHVTPPNKGEPFMIEQAIQGTLGSINTADPKSNPDMVLTASIDALRFPLRRALQHVKGSFSNSNAEGVNELAVAVALGQLYEIFDNCWKSSLWGRRVLTRHENIDVFGPTSDEETIVSAVSAYRRQVLSAETVHHVTEVWKELDSVYMKNLLNSMPKIQVKGKGKKRRLEISRDSQEGKRAGIMLIYRMTVDRDYYVPFFELALPDFPDLTIREIYSVWEILHAVAAALLDGLPKVDNKRITTIDGLSIYSPIMYYNQIIELIKKRLDFSSAKIFKILSFLTINDNSTSELWSRPLVRLDERSFLMIWSPIVLGNMPRTVEIWMKEGGLDLGESGYLFEESAHAELTREISRSPLLRDAEVFSSNVEFVCQDQTEEIDLIVRIGHIVLIGEMKCMLFPSEPIEKFRYYETLQKAANQIARKLQFVQTNSREFEDFVGLISHASGNAYEYHPLILVNQAFGVGYTIQNIPVVDLLVLERFFDGKWEQFVTRSSSGVSKVGKTTYFYASEREAAESVVRYISSPPQLAFYFKNVKVVEQEIARISADQRRIQLIHAEVQLPVPAMEFIFGPDSWI